VKRSGTVLLGTEWSSGSWLEAVFVGGGDKKYNSCLMLINTVFYVFDIYKLII
jgi:hypothetical protein